LEGNCHLAEEVKRGGIRVNRGEGVVGFHPGGFIRFRGLGLSVRDQKVDAYSTGGRQSFGKGGISGTLANREDEFFASK